eukprot:jgi/Psemu1/195820/e_gw1.178.40.1
MSRKSEEQEWIEQPGGWDGDQIETLDGTIQSEKIENKDTGSDEDDDSDAQGHPGFDFFADSNPEDTFPFAVSLPDGTSAHLELEGFKLDTDEAAQSTGVTLWKAAPRLADYLVTERDDLVAGKSVLELGAGLGLCGMVAHHLGAERVLLTDADTITLQKMRTNLQTNCPNRDRGGNEIGVRQLIWNNLNQMKDCGPFDTILGADVIYAISSLQPLFDTVVYFLGREDDDGGSRPGKPTRTFVLSRYCKWGNISDDTVLDAARARNLTWTHPSEGIYVFRLQGEHE